MSQLLKVQLSFTLFIASSMLITLGFWGFLEVLPAIVLLGVLVWINARFPVMFYIVSYVHAPIMILSFLMLVFWHQQLTWGDILAGCDGLISFINVDRLASHTDLYIFLGIISNVMSKNSDTKVVSTILVLITTALWCFAYLVTKPDSILPQNAVILTFMIMRALIPMTQVYITMFPNGCTELTDRQMVLDHTFHVREALWLTLSKKKRIAIYLLLLSSNTFILASGNNQIIILRELL